MTVRLFLRCQKIELLKEFGAIEHNQIVKTNDDILKFIRYFLVIVFICTSILKRSNVNENINSFLYKLLNRFVTSLFFNRY